MEPGVKEIQNLKNTCYINSAINLLAHVTPLKQLLCEDLNKEDLPDNAEYSIFRLLKLFHQVINDIWSDKQMRLIPEAFVKKCFTLTPYFVPFTQQDSQEFLMVLLDKLDQELISLNSEKFSIINHIFKGTYTNEIKCLTCSLTSQRSESFIQLSLPIPENLPPNDPLDSLMSKQERSMIADSEHNLITSFISIFKSEKASLNLYYCLSAFLKNEVTDFYCSNCKEDKPHNISPQLTEAPNCFLISLKRFQYKFWSSKVSESVFLPKSLNLSYISNLQIEYTLCAIIEHSGFLFRGHYKIYVKKGNQWWLLNDKRIRKCSWEEVFNSQAYICLYAKKELFNRVDSDSCESVYMPKSTTLPSRFASRKEGL